MTNAEEKVIMLKLCDCDRFEDVHLKGCSYLLHRQSLRQQAEDIIEDLEMWVGLNDINEIKEYIKRARMEYLQAGARV